METGCQEISVFNAIKKIKNTKQHLWFLSKQKFDDYEQLLEDSFFNSFDTAFIVAPHMDDEVFGSFQLINKLISMNKIVKIIFCVSKENGIETFKRIKESKNLFLSVEKRYLGINDSKVQEEKDILKEKLLNILKSEKSLYVYPEYTVTNHKDHNAVNQVMNEICLLQKQDCVLKTELIVLAKRNCYLQVKNIDEKIDAIGNYKSQKNHADYKKIVKFLASSGNKTEYREHYAK